ncbi:hemolysin activation/secretion protein [Fluviicoccus keumensis]|uniref:Hemolysin activation/secretion protein n=1 Tax=Fluviicoccus keumensis TaxID=1435465 RepID=A0A4Q7YMK3_9GAMM|nr:ShlB/FhaC/HecB family hemolysin secretion/activation protein [Fluviicoccus keumensis]RZU38600.1 hemolysin activation/secretion protein [Fluviicoccus keumensis]
MDSQNIFPDSRLRAALGLILLLVSGHAGADSGTDSLRLLREQQQQLDQMRRQEQARPSGAADIASPVPASPLNLPTAQCLDVKTLRWEGNAPLAETVRKHLAQQYTPRCLDEAALSALLRDANLALLRAGYVTSRVLLPDNAFQEGVLRLSLVTGRIAEIKADGLKPREWSAAFPGLRDGAFRLPDLEQGLDQLNRLASNRVQAELRPGVRLGESGLWLSNRPASRWHGLAGLDNSGSPDTGRAVAIVGLARDNLLGSGDYWNLALRRSFSGDDSAWSQGLSLYASQPFGYWTGSASLALAQSQTPLVLPGVTLHSRTVTTMPGVRLERVLHRDAHAIWSAQAGIARRKTDSRLDDERLDISSPTHSSVELALQYDGLSPLPWSARLSRTQGVRWFGADHDTDETAAAGLPRAQFEKWRLDLHARYRAGNWLYLADAAGQYSPNRLPGAEELMIADAGSVRGFQDTGVSVRRGWYLRQTLMHFFSPALQPYAGLDAGHGLTREGSEWLGSTSVGLLVSLRKQTLDIAFSPGWRQGGALPSPQLQARYSASF